MTQEEKQLLIKDLCARLPYDDYKVQIKDEEDDIPRISVLVPGYIDDIKYCVFASVKPYLRPMSSMTEEEVFEYLSMCNKDSKDILIAPRYFGLDYLLSHHLDYHGLIEKGLALEAPENMYKTE